MSIIKKIKFLKYNKIKFLTCQVNVVNGYRDSYHSHLTDFENLIKIAGIPDFNIKEHFNVLKKVYQDF